MAFINGRIPQTALSPITVSAAGDQAYLVHEAADAFMAMNRESELKFNVTLRATSARAAYRPLKDQVYFWGLYIAGRGNLAARPGTSNHGWGLAVDFATPQMRSIVDKIGEQYGFAKKWSDAPTEWWHIRYTPGHWNGHKVDPTIRKGSKDKASILTLQHLLHGLNLTNVINGSYGIWTRRAVRRFQEKHGMKVDGVVGPATWAAIRKAA